MTQLKAFAVVVSDIHLGHSDDSRALKLLELIKSAELGEVEYFILLGDIFDFCLGSHPYFRKKFAPIGAALSRLAASRTRVIYIEGNHEFRLKDFAWAGVEVVPSGTFNLTLGNGRSIQAAHGDMIFSHRRYKTFRWVVKSWFVTTVASFFPGRWLDSLTSKTSEVSRSADQYRVIRHDKILGAVDAWIAAGDAEYGIFGHFHIPYAEPRLDGKRGAVLSVDCWDKPNALVFDEQGIQRWWLEDNRWEPVKPLVRPELARATYPDFV